MKCTICDFTDFEHGVCKGCGAKQSGASAAAPVAPVAVAPAFGATAGDMHVDVRACPDCGAARKANARFCNACRYDYMLKQSGQPNIGGPAVAPVAAPGTVVSAPAAAPAPVAPPKPLRLPAQEMRAVATIDPQHFATCNAQFGLDDIKLPDPLPEPESFVLSGDLVLIGRHSKKLRRQPDIAVNGDVGVSRPHCKLVLQDDGTYALFDGPEQNIDAELVCDSDNGTLLNGAEVPKGKLTPVKIGDTIHIGFWTRIEIQAQ